jgi:hypothetical protein
MTIAIKPKSIFIFFLGSILFLLFANIAGFFIRFYFSNEFTYHLTSLFNLGLEKNIPTYFASCLLLLSAGIVLLIAIRQESAKIDHRYWFGLSVIMLFLSIDEATQIHEKLIEPMQRIFSTSGFLAFGWIIPCTSPAKKHWRCLVRQPLFMPCSYILKINSNI